HMTVRKPARSFLPRNNPVRARARPKARIGRKLVRFPPFSVPGLSVPERRVQDFFVILEDFYNHFISKQF
ncbi:MAG: hypothetical protein KA398_00340, partial [Bacteroides sp.]|nr:hypothetical protein [Bacteroides sp.]